MGDRCDNDAIAGFTRVSHPSVATTTNNICAVAEIEKDMDSITFVPTDPQQRPSKLCQGLSSWLGKAVENAGEALRAIVLIQESDLDRKLRLTALKKYVEDTGEAIKTIDNKLKKHGSSLVTLIFEIPETGEEDMSWRNLIGRRDVIAHKLLNINDERVYSEAVRDFKRLHLLLTKIHFYPYKISSANAMKVRFPPEQLKSLIPHTRGPLTIGQSLILIVEHEHEGLFSARLGWNDDDERLSGVVVQYSYKGPVATELRYRSHV